MAATRAVIVCSYLLSVGKWRILRLLFTFVLACSWVLYLVLLSRWVRYHGHTPRSWYVPNVLTHSVSKAWHSIYMSTALSESLWKTLVTCYRESSSFPVFVVIIVFFAPGIQLDIQHCSRVCCSTGSQHYHLENFIFESFNFATFLQVYFMYPETVSRSLEEIFSQGHTLTAWKIGKIVCKKTLKEVVEKSKNLPVTFFFLF